MLRHEFQPGKLIAGIFVTIAGITYVGDAGGAWETPWFALFPLLMFGCRHAHAHRLPTACYRNPPDRCLRRARRAASTEKTDAPARIRGIQAIR